MRKLKLFSLLCLLLIGVGQMWAEKDDVVYKYGGTGLGTNNAYQNYDNSSIASADAGSSVSTASWAATCGSNQSQKLWLGANSNQKAKMILSTGSYSEVSAIASAIGVTTSATYYAALIGRTDFENVYKVTLEYSTPGGTAPSEAWILYSTDNGSTWSVGKKVTSLSTSGTDFEFDETIASARYAFVIHSTNYCQFKVPILTFYEGTTGGDDPGDDPDPGTQKADVTDEQLAWSAASAEVTMEAENTFPTLTNSLELSVTYQSTNTAVATIDANGDITLDKAGTTTIKAIFAGNDDYNAKTVQYTLTVNKAPLQPIAGAVVDVLTAANFTATQTQYTNFSGKQATNEGHSDAVYAGNTAKNSTNIQMTSKDSNKSPQIASTTSGGKVKRVEVVYGGSNTANRKVTVYGRNTAYNGSSYDTTNDTKLGEITYASGDESGYIDVTGDYTYLVIITSGAMYFSEIRISWLPSAKHELTFGVASSGHGTLAASVGGAPITTGAQVAEGATVTLTPTAHTYYQVNAVEVIDGNADEVTTTKNGDVYTFAMPTSDAIAEVSFAYIPVTALTLNKTELEMLVGGASETLSVTAVEPANAYAGVTWSSENTNIATVNSETGVVTAVAASEDPVNIIATSIATGTVTATCAVTVTAPTGHEIGITSENGTVTANTGVDVADVLKDVAVVLTATPNDGYTISGWTVVGAEYTVSEDKTTCSFTMPDDEVLIEVAYTHEVAVLKLHDAAGVTEFAGNHFWMEEVTLPTSAASCSKTFVGWSANAECTTAPELGATYVLPNIGDNDIYAVYASVVSAGVTSYVKTALGAIESGSVVIVTHDNGDLYAMSNDQGASNAPTAVAVTDEEGVLTEGVADNVLWTITKDGDNLSFAKGTDKLYCTSSNNGVRVGSGAANVFIIKDKYLYNTGNSAYVGVYTSTDWRRYTSINANIQNQTLAFYKKTVSDPVYGNYSTTCQQQVAAPTFSVDEGTYYAEQSIEINKVEGATVYYTVDGTTPTTSSATYSAAISLSERAITTIKAIAVAEGYEKSEVAEATYNINLPYDFADFADLTKENGKEYAVRGIISEKGELNTQYNELPYWISADGSTTGQIKCHNGLGLNKAEFTTESAAAVNPGDNVTVVGTWSTQYNNIGAANWMFEYTARVPANPAYEIVGNLTTNTFDEGETFDAGILANLSVNALFTNGYKEAVDGVTFTYGEKATWASADEKLTVTAVKNEENLVSRDFGVTVTSATLVSIALKPDDENYQTKVEYYEGEAFVAPTIVATLSDETTVEAVATYKEGFDNTTAGVQNVTVSYTRGEITKNVSYAVTVKAIYNTLETAYDASEAKHIIENVYASGTESSDNMYVHGVVIADANSEGTYFISDDGTDANKVQIYKGKYFDSSTSAKDNVKEGDEVIVKGHILVWSNAAEMKTTTIVSQFRAPEFAFANIVADDEFEVNISENLAVVPTANSGDAEFTLSSGNTAAVTIVEGKLHAVAEGDAVITAHRDATANENALNYNEATTTFNVHVIAERTRFAVSFDANGGSGDDPVIANQLAGATVDLPENPYSKENSAFAGWVVNDGAVEITEGHFTMPEGNVTIKATWNTVETCAISFMVNGATAAETVNVPQEVAYTLTQVGTAVDGFTFVGWSETEAADEVAAKPAIITSFTPAAGLDEKVLYGIYSRHDDSDPNYGKYEKATAIVDGDYLIVNETASAAFDGSLTTLDAVSNKVAVTIADGVIASSTAIENAVFTIDVAAGTLKSHSNKYIGVNSNSNGLKQADIATTYTNTFSVDGEGNAVIKANFSGSTMYLRFNKANNQDRFRYYSNQGQEAIQLYKKNTGTMWYTSSPAEKVAITFDANGGEGGCNKAIINKGSELTICETAPTKSHSEFAGWKNGDDEYVAGQAYTFNADITLTAQWNDAATYTVTFEKNEGEGMAENLEGQYAGDEITLPAALTKDGFTFQGWKFNDKLYKAGASFILPAANVEFVAQFRKTSVPTNKMSLVTDASALANGMQIALGCNYDNTFIMAGDLGSNKYMASITEDVSLVDNIATYPNTVVVLTLEQVEDGWNLTKDGANYLTLSGSSDLKWDTKANATVWAISFNSGNVKIAIGDYWIQYNSGSPRFKPYSSSQKQIQLFGQAVVVSENVNISDLGYTEGATIVADGDITLTIDEQTNAQSITAKNGATVVIGQATTAESVVVEEGSKIVANAETTTPTVYFSTTMGVTDNNGDFHGVASELGEVTNINLATGGEIIYDLTLGTNKDGVQADPNQWHAFSLPFAVDALNGIYDAETGDKLENEVNYAIMDYHGDIRANGDYGWKKYRGILQPGVFYLMTVDGNTKTFRFKASVTGPMSDTNSMSAKAYDGAGEDSDKGWNGFGNPRWIGGTFAYNAQYLDPYTYEYVTITPGMTIPVGLPFFYKASTTSDVAMDEVGTTYAPARNKAYEIKNVVVRFGNEVSKDKLYISASEDALYEYEQDKDLVKMFMSKTPKVARISGNAYGMKLCMVNAPIVNDQATYGLTLYAPAAGEYTISAPEMENADIYLTYEGSIIWNLSMGEYTSDFAKGNNEGYGLLLVKKAPQVTTGVDNAEANETGVQKVIINEHVYILRAEQMYDVTGKLVK